MSRLRAKAGVNAPCPCGSGQKYKRCCRAKGELKLILSKEAWIVIFMVLVGLFIYILSTAPSNHAAASAGGGGGGGSVWSQEHGHWHHAP